MGKLYFGDAYVRIWNAGLKPINIYDPKGKIVGIAVDKGKSLPRARVYQNSVGLYDEAAIAAIIVECNGQA